ncbi:MAG: hypothetical protein KGL11_07210 [Alphaproteobacteria bacterium]|nr:hypothetical protein [Alphaproteobacteria bacterium]
MLLARIPAINHSLIIPNGLWIKTPFKVRCIPKGPHRGLGTLFNSLLHNRRTPVEVKSGDRFFRRRRDKVMELVTVTDLRADSLGIPHVHFKLTFEESAIGRVEGGRRVLALNSFVEAYSQRLA